MIAPLKKVAITGPESTGKSTLARQLAAHYGTVWVPEYARTYLADLGHPYTAADVEAIARGQMHQWAEILPQARQILLADTDLLVIKIWMLHAYGFCPDWVLEALKKQDFDLYLLMAVDLPWEADPQREHPHLRQFFYDWYKRELDAYGFRYTEIAGNQEMRQANAIRAVDAAFLGHVK